MNTFGDTAFQTFCSKNSCYVFVVEGSIPTATFDLEKPSKSHLEKINNDNFLYTQST